MKPLILDVDTGLDDARMTLFAVLHPELDRCAVTCVGANAPVDDVVRHTGDIDPDPHGVAPLTVTVGLRADGPWYAAIWRRIVAGGR